MNRKVYQTSTNQQQQQMSSKRPNTYQEPEQFVSEIKCFDVYLNSKGFIQYFCILCGETIEDNMNHIFHLRQHFNGDLSCKDWKDHCNNNKGFNLYSSSCNEIFDGLYDFINHLNVIHYNKENEQKRKNVEKMSCMYCNQKFDDPHERLKHITMNHLLENSHPALSNNLVLVEENPLTECWIERLPPITDKRQSTTNNIVQKSYSNNSNDIHNNITKKTCNATTNSKKRNNRKLKSGTEIKTAPLPKVLESICEICGKQFMCQRNLSNHLSTVHGNLRLHTCTICNKSFSHVSYLKPHMRIHTNEKPYECKLCYKKYRMLSELTAHMLRHNNLRRHPCTVCDKKFFTTKALRSHLNVHTGAKPYPCDICHTHFRTTDALRSHRRLHTGEKPYECKMCGKRFPSMAGLHSHMKNHK